MVLGCRNQPSACPLRMEGIRVLRAERADHSALAHRGTSPTEEQVCSSGCRPAPDLLPPAGMRLWIRIPFA